MTFYHKMLLLLLLLLLLFFVLIFFLLFFLLFLFLLLLLLLLLHLFRLLLYSVSFLLLSHWCLSLFLHWKILRFSFSRTNLLRPVTDVTNVIFIHEDAYANVAADNKPSSLRGSKSHVIILTAVILAIEVVYVLPLLGHNIIFNICLPYIFVLTSR